MLISEWLSLAAICALGAISPGPSLAIVLKHTLRSGRGHGIVVALSHALGIGIYAFAAAAGLAVLLSQSPKLFELLRYAGAAFLVYLGVRSWIGAATALPQPDNDAVAGGNGSWIKAARDGFLLAFLNPKIAVFFMALFSQFVSENAAFSTKLGMALMAMSIDGLWYVIVAFGLSHGAIIPVLRRNGLWIGRAVGIVLIAVAARVLFL